MHTADATRIVVAVPPVVVVVVAAAAAAVFHWFCYILRTKKDPFLEDEARQNPDYLFIFENWKNA